jgi:hypothetical protein
MLTVKSFETDFILKPGYGLLDALLKHLHKHWSAVTYLISNESTSNNIYELEASHSHIQMLERLLVLFVNLSYVAENEKYLALHAPFINYILDCLWCKEDALANLSLQILCNLAPSIIISDVNPKFVSYVFGFLYHESVSVIATAVATFARLSDSSENMPQLARIDASFFTRLEELTFLGSDDDGIRESCLSIYYNFVHFGTMKTKVQIAHHTNCIRNMITLLSYYALSPSEKNINTAIKIANILYAFATEAKNIHLFTSYEEFFVNITLNTVNPTLQKVIGDMLSELTARF